MGMIGNLGLPDDARSPFEGMRQTKQALDRGCRRRSPFQIEDTLPALIKQLARLEAEIFIGIRRHLLTPVRGAIGRACLNLRWFVSISTHSPLCPNGAEREAPISVPGVFPIFLR